MAERAVVSRIVAEGLVVAVVLELAEGLGLEIRVLAGALVVAAVLG